MSLLKFILLLSLLFITISNSTIAGELVYSTYLGGSEPDVGYSIAVDKVGNAYLTGYTRSLDFPFTAGVIDTTQINYGHHNIIISKLDPSGSSLVYSTILSGTQPDNDIHIVFTIGHDIAVDSVGNVYITGMNSYLDFPVTQEAYDTTYHGGYVSKLDTTGSNLLYSTFLGGGIGNSIAIDSLGNAYITGYDSNGDFRVTPNAFDTTYNGGDDAIVCKLNPNGTNMIYSSFLGGNGDDMGTNIGLDKNGNIYITGLTGSSNFPITTEAFSPTNKGGYDTFVTKIIAEGSHLIYSTYIGGSDYDIGTGITVDNNWNSFIVGYTQSTNFPVTSNAYDTSHNGLTDIFICKLNAIGSSLYSSTYLGGNGYDYGTGIILDEIGFIDITGYTNSTDFPVTQGAFDKSYNGSNDNFICMLNPNGFFPVYSTYLGGSGDDKKGLNYSSMGYYQGNIAHDNNGGFYITGRTDSLDFPVTPYAYNTSLNMAMWARSDVFITKLNIQPTLAPLYPDFQELNKHSFINEFDNVKP